MIIGKNVKSLEPTFKVLSQSKLFDFTNVENSTFKSLLCSHKFRKKLRIENSLFEIQTKKVANKLFQNADFFLKNVLKWAHSSN